MQYQKGSYTIEASLLMGIILSVLVAIIFYLHDRSFIQGAAHESACAYSLHADSDKKDAGIAKRLISGRLLGSKNVTATISDGKKNVSVYYKGTFPIPKMAADFWGSRKLSMESKVMLTIERPPALIQKIRGAAKIVDRVRGD